MEFSAIRSLVDDRVDHGHFSVHRDIFRDPAVFELEMQHIFEGTWVFLGLEAQIPKAHDFYTTWIGRHPVVVSRDRAGRLHCFINSCRHRGAIVCHTMRGNRKYHVCQYHGWAYDSAGRLVDIKDHERACYPESFAQADHNLTAVPRFDSYRGFLFGSLNADVLPLDEHLGDAKVFLDLVADQGADGVELLPGTHSYTFDANWKLQIENCIDAYHLTSTHPSYIDIVERRKRGASQNQMSSVDFALYKNDQAVRGSFCFPNGYNVLWGANPAYRARPLFQSIDDLLQRVGEVRARWMLSMRNLTLFPNAQFAENASLQLRVIRPIAVDRTEMTTWCVAPKGEGAAARRLRLRQYEDFFNASGLATPDDSIAFEDCQTGYQSRSQPWQQGYVRGIGRLEKGGNQHSAELGVTPLTSVEGPFDVQDETIFHSIYREWLRLIESGLRRTGAVREAAFCPEPAK